MVKETMTISNQQQSMTELLEELSQTRELHRCAVECAAKLLAHNCELMTARDMYKSKAEYYKGLIDEMPAKGPARTTKAKGW
jgi:hypothetical protein